MNTLVPTDITLDQGKGILTITWSDGQVCHYPLGPLRMACPCAECRGGHEKMGREYDPSSLADLVPSRDYQAEQIELVGHYALQISWNDGHNSGIYTWAYLRRLCPGEDTNA